MCPICTTRTDTDRSSSRRHSTSSHHPERSSSAGWESLSGASDASHLQPVGTLRDEALDEPTLDEHHPHGTHLWSPDAPIAPRWHPYNLCTVWQCPTCARAFLRYTEHGGYYVDERIRLLDGRRVEDGPDR
jgi:hypothetical protein